MKTLFGQRTVIGFTGTQEGMTQAQRKAFGRVIKSLSPTDFRHGDCVGADAHAHDIVTEMFPQCVVTLHPPIIQNKRAFCAAKVTLPQKDYLDRNHDIVDASEVMIATPKEMHEELRSGTWATIRYARKKNKKLIIIYPDGTTGA